MPDIALRKQLNDLWYENRSRDRYRYSHSRKRTSSPLNLDFLDRKMRSYRLKKLKMRVSRGSRKRTSIARRRGRVIRRSRRTVAHNGTMYTGRKRTRVTRKSRTRNRVKMTKAPTRPKTGMSFAFKVDRRLVIRNDSKVIPFLAKIDLSDNHSVHVDIPTMADLPDKIMWERFQEKLDLFQYWRAIGLSAYACAIDSEQVTALTTGAETNVPTWQALDVKKAFVESYFIPDTSIRGSGIKDFAEINWIDIKGITGIHRIPRTHTPKLVYNWEIPSYYKDKGWRPCSESAKALLSSKTLFGVMNEFYPELYDATGGHEIINRPNSFYIATNCPNLKPRIGIEEDEPNKPFPNNMVKFQDTTYLIRYWWKFQVMRYDMLNSAIGGKASGEPDELCKVIMVDAHTGEFTYKE